MLHPPGSGTTARPRRARSGPSTQKPARIRRTNPSLARTGDGSAVSISDNGGIAQRMLFSVSLPFCDVTRIPKQRSNWAWVRTSASRGTSSSRTGSVARIAAAMIGSAAFFEPLARTLPCKATPPVI